MGEWNNGNATAGIAMATDASSNGSGTAAPLILTMAGTIGAMIVTGLEIVSIGNSKLSRVAKRGRGIAAARVFVSEAKLSAPRAITPRYSSVAH